MRALTKVILITAFIFIYLSSLTPAQSSGDLDTTFGNGGMVITDIAGYIDGAFSVALQSDGKIILTGYSTQSVGMDREMTSVRYLPDGSIDSSFGINGIVITDVSDREGEAYSNAIQSDGKIVIGGYSKSSATNNDDFTVVRYESDGSLDSTFGTGGIVTTEIRSDNDVLEALTIQPNGKIIGVGWSSDNPNDGIALIRYNTDGSLDNSFSGDGIAITDIYSHQDYGCAIALQADGKIIVTGHTIGAHNLIFVARYKTTGYLDDSFGQMGNGIVTILAGSISFATDVTIQDDGKIIICGYSDYFGPMHFTLARFNENGTMDDSFGFGGWVNTNIGSSSEANSIKIATDGKIVVGGTDLARYKFSGDLDLSFGTAGIVSGFDLLGYSLDLQQDAKILLAGKSGDDFAVARFNVVYPTTIDDNNNFDLIDYHLLQNYPNPFNPTTTITYQIPKLSFVKLKVYDVLGNEIATLVNEEKPSGTFEAEFDGTDQPSGVYFYRLKTGNYFKTRKMILLK